MPLRAQRVRYAHILVREGGHVYSLARGFSRQGKPMHIDSLSLPRQLPKHNSPSIRGDVNPAVDAGIAHYVLADPAVAVLVVVDS